MADVKKDAVIPYRVGKVVRYMRVCRVEPVKDTKIVTGFDTKSRKHVSRDINELSNIHP